MKLPFIIFNPYEIIGKYLTTTKRVLFWDVFLLLFFLVSQLFLFTNSFKFLLPRSFRRNQFLKKVATFFGLLNFYFLISCWIPLDQQMVSPIWQFQSSFWFKLMFFIGWLFVLIQLPLYYSATLFDFSKTFQRFFRSGTTDQINPLKSILSQDNSPIFFDPICCQNNVHRSNSFCWKSHTLPLNFFFFNIRRYQEWSKIHAFFNSVSLEQKSVLTLQPKNFEKKVLKDLQKFNE
ncbi:hypothetical protein M0813_09550 [Anaeramoeba flamelloides]|uniref:Uncharacterized protein n=1 Tax=Anaeramoeba flamelloides TaxID=1746091 RepID=A0ABQ8X4R5_9EUKA|nr:hypothetical protein M0813_09550 [Anaeramoeba flamelloides]